MHLGCTQDALGLAISQGLPPLLTHGQYEHCSTEAISTARNTSSNIHTKQRTQTLTGPQRKTGPPTTTPSPGQITGSLHTKILRSTPASLGKKVKEKPNKFTISPSRSPKGKQHRLHVVEEGPGCQIEPSVQRGHPAHERCHLPNRKTAVCVRFPE